jgi:CDP-4-dehydro-6-deoxyglucose reductase
MADLEYNSRHFRLNPHESVLDCLLRNGQVIPYSCKAGICQACLIKAVACEATPESQKWVKPQLRAKGYTLACQWVPENNVQAALPGIKEFSVEVSINAFQLLTPSVLCIRLIAADPCSMFACKPGQYISLINPSGVTRSYSIANDPEQDQFIELHIAATSHGVFSTWLFREATKGLRLHIRGPAGECFYTNIDGNTYPLILAGVGTGLAPLFGVVKDALYRGHQGNIYMFHGARSTSYLYHVQELRRLAQTHSNFHYHPSVPDGPVPTGVHQGDIESWMDMILQKNMMVRAKAFLCGAPDFVHQVRKLIFLKGVRASHIYCDPFTERSVIAPDNTGK